MFKRDQQGHSANILRNPVWLIQGRDRRPERQEARAARGRVADEEATVGRGQGRGLCGPDGELQKGFRLGVGGRSVCRL